MFILDYKSVHDALEWPHRKGAPRRGYKPQGPARGITRRSLRGFERMRVRGVAWFEDWRATDIKYRRGRRSNAE